MGRIEKKFRTRKKAGIREIAGQSPIRIHSGAKARRSEGSRRRKTDVFHFFT